jgi:sulfate permease, SulP family
VKFLPGLFHTWYPKVFENHFPITSVFIMLKKTLIPDILAGLTVSFAAIALGAAFGTMSGRGAFAGMLAAAIIPIITSAFGGTRLQASGPTAPMTAVSALLVAFAYDQFPERQLAEQFITLVFIMSSLLIFVMGILRSGNLIRLVPNVVVLGFMNGIAALIWVDQVKKMTGSGDSKILEGGIVTNIVVIIATFILIYTIPYLLHKFHVRRTIQLFLPGVLVSILLMTLLTTSFYPSLERISMGADVNSIGDFFDHLVSYFPTMDLIKFEYLLRALPYAGQIAVLAYLDSLLTALVIDQMTKEKSNLNKELLAQGVANGASALMQGIPGAQATIRSVLLIKEGAQTRLAGILIGVFALFGVLILKDYLTLVAAAVFVGVLLKAGADVFDFEFPKYYFQHKWYRNKMRNIQFGFIIYTTLVTIIIDLNVAVISATMGFYVAKKYLSISDCEMNISELMDADFENKSLHGVATESHHEHHIFEDSATEPETIREKTI